MMGLICINFDLKGTTRPQPWLIQIKYIPLTCVTTIACKPIGHNIEY